jgi:hypothetical protein
MTAGEVVIRRPKDIRGRRRKASLLIFSAGCATVGNGARVRGATMSDAGAVLSKIPLFSEVLDEAQIERLGAKCHFAVFSPGSMLMAEGDFGMSMFAIVEGRVSVSLAD